MIPGPVEPYPEAHVNLLKKVMPHYGERWIDTYYTIIDKLKRLFKTRQHVHIYPGSGTAVMEMGLSTIIEEGDKILFVNKGYFVDRFRRIAEIHGAETHQVAPDEYGDRVDNDELKYMIEVTEPKAIVIVHSETSTGVLEDIMSISKIVPEETFIFVDAISSFGALNIECDKWGVDLCVGYASKALGAINGIVPFMVSERLWEYSDLRDRRPKSFSMDLGIWREYVEEWRTHPYPVSISTPLMMALDKAVDIVLECGIEDVEKRHYKISSIVRDWIEELGFEPIPKREYASPTVSVFKLPDDIDSRDVIKMMEREYGILISSTWLIKINGLRIGHMGPTADEKYIIPTLYGLENVVGRIRNRS
jgi:aspartate aminotransferase-like enzyme